MHPSILFACWLVGFWFFWVIVRSHNGWGSGGSSAREGYGQSQGNLEYGLQNKGQIGWQGVWGGRRLLIKVGLPRLCHCYGKWLNSASLSSESLPVGFPILGPYVILSGPQQYPWEYNFTWKVLRREGKAAPLHSSYPQCKLPLQGGRLALNTSKNILTISEDQSAEAYNELAGIGSKRLTDYLSRIRKGGSCFEWEVGLGDWKCI